MSYTLLHCHSYFSLLDGFGSPEQNASRAKELDLTALAITDHGNVFGHVQHYEACKKADIKPILGCLLKGQEIVTINGVKNIENINVGDQVLTHKGRFRRVTATMNKPYSGNIYSIDLNGNHNRKLQLTEEHPILIRGQDGKISWKKPSEIKTGYGYKRGLSRLENYYSSVCIPKISYNNNNEKIDVLQFLPKDFYENKGKISRKKSYNKYDSDKHYDIPAEIHLDQEFAYFLGLYCAEGSVNTEPDGKLNGQITLSFNISEMDFSKSCEDIFIQKFGLKNSKTYVRPDKSIRETYAGSVPLAYFLSNSCGKLAKNKKVPDFIFKSNNKIRDSFVKGLLDGDGKKSSQKVFKVCSRNLAWGLRQLIVNNGFFNQVSHRIDNGYESFIVNYTPNRKHSYCFDDENYTYRPIKKIEKNHICSTVYNIEVEEDNSYVSDFVLHNCELYVSHENAPNKKNGANSHMVVLAKNQKGLETLWELVSQTNDKEYFYYKPRIHLFNNGDEKGLEHFVRDGNIIGISGHQGSHLSDNLFADLWGDPDVRKAQIKAAYAQKKGQKTDWHKQFLKENWLEDTCELALKIEKIFGKGNFYIELQNELDPKDALALWIHPLIVDCLRQVSKETGIPAVASSDPHYSRKEDAEPQRLMVMTKMKETVDSVNKKLEMMEDEGHDLMVFFGSDNFYIHSYDEMSKNFTKEELDRTNEIADKIEDYDLFHDPYIPDYEIPTDLEFKGGFYDICLTNQDKYLMYLCVQGAAQIEPWNNSEFDKSDYWERINSELSVIFEVGLSNYFLVVWDYCNAAANRPKDHSFNWKENLKRGGDIDPIPMGLGRGSSAGSLISFLIGITGIDPLKYGLIFERFYNKGRNTATRKELPDIDTDFGIKDREWVIDYLKHQYGEDNVAQMVTLQRMQGKAALKDIFRVSGIENYFELGNAISKYMENEATVADELRELRDEHGKDYGLIRYAIEHSDEVKKFYDDEKLTRLFDLAMRCENRKRSQGKHPSGVVITPKPIGECFPLVIDTKTKEHIVGLEMDDAAKAGSVKLDILAVAILDKMKAVEDMVNGKKELCEDG